MISEDLWWIVALEIGILAAQLITCCVLLLGVVGTRDNFQFVGEAILKIHKALVVRHNGLPSDLQGQLQRV